MNNICANGLVAYSVVIPIFNESRNIPLLYKRLKVVLGELKKEYEIILVDDGSKDGSYQLLKEIAYSDNGVKVLSFIHNFGQHKAIVAGILESKGYYVITLDADLQNPPEEIPKLLSEIKQGFDMVSGRRLIRKDALFRKICSFFVNLIISLLTGLHMKDYGSMLRVFRKETAYKLAGAFFKNQGYITMLIAQITHNVKEIPIGHDERYAGTSKYSLKKLFLAFFKIIFCCHNKKGPKEAIFIIKKKIDHGKEYIIRS